ncbi:MAG: helix-turn-helix transcriptional regulator [Synergistaceae bacterium]|nr:helix-turn-helix transcriptional regulator [Synergistaceae bacterium]
MEEKNFAQRLKELRRKARLTQEELANLIKVSPITVRRWEWGHRTPRMEEIKKLCEVLHVSEAELLNEPQGEQIKLTLSWHWEEMKEGEIDMNNNHFQIVLGDSGQIGITGAAMFPTRSAIDDFIARVREQVEVAYDAQVRRGAIKGSEE